MARPPEQDGVEGAQRHVVRHAGHRHGRVLRREARGLLHGLGTCERSTRLFVAFSARDSRLRALVAPRLYRCPPVLSRGPEQTPWTSTSTGRHRVTPRTARRERALTRSLFSSLRNSRRNRLSLVARHASVHRRGGGRGAPEHGQHLPVPPDLRALQSARGGAPRAAVHRHAVHGADALPAVLLHKGHLRLHSAAHVRHRALLLLPGRHRAVG